MTRLHTLFVYDNIHSLRALGSDLMNNRPQDATVCGVCARILHQNLIKMPINWIGRVIYSCAPKKWQWEYCKRLVTSMYYNRSILSCYAKMIQHMVSGVDTSDSKSAGGWNEEEFNKFLDILEECGYKFDNEAWWLNADFEPEKQVRCKVLAMG